MNIEITDREFDQIIAALRLWQWKGPDHDPSLCDERERQLLEIASEHGNPFTNKSIDALCVRLNVAAKPLGLPEGSVVEQLWWFIENVTDETPNRSDLFFQLRERVRDEHARVRADHGPIATGNEAGILLAEFADWAREHAGPSDSIHATLVRAVAFLDGAGKREEAAVLRCAGCGEAWPCSDSKRRDISGRERAKHYVGGSAG